MPKPIKKRVYRKPSTQEDVRSFFYVFKEYYDENKKFVNLVAIVFVVGLFLIFAGGYYLRSTTQKALYFQYEGLRAFHEQLPDKKGKDALKVAYEKFQRSYNKKKSPYSLLYMAYAEHRLGKNSEAIETLNKVLKEYETPDVRSLAYYKMYEIYLSENKTDRAMQALDNLLSLEGDYLKDLALYNKARALESMNKSDEARKVYETLAERYPGSPFTKKIEDKIKKKEKGMSKATDKGAGK